MKGRVVGGRRRGFLVLALAALVLGPLAPAAFAADYSLTFDGSVVVTAGSAAAVSDSVGSGTVANTGGSAASVLVVFASSAGQHTGSVDVICGGPQGSATNFDVADVASVWVDVPVAPLVGAAMPCQSHLAVVSGSDASVDGAQSGGLVSSAPAGGPQDVNIVAIDSGLHDELRLQTFVLLVGFGFTTFSLSAIAVGVFKRG